MTQLEFAYKNFKGGTKVIVTENKLSTFYILNVLSDYKEEYWSLFGEGHWNNSPEKRKTVFFGREYIENQNSGFNFYLITEEY